MSIASEITRINNNIASAYTACDNKGATMPATQDSANLADCIDSIPSGGGGADSGGKYLVQVIDYDGTVLQQDHLDEGETFTLPDSPTGRPRLTFKEWVAPITITNGAITMPEHDIVIGAIYRTTSGLTEFDVVVTSATGKTVTINMDGTKDWGDGTTDTNTSHTYTDYGEYTITSDGTTFSGALCGQSSSSPNYYLLKARICGVQRPVSYLFEHCHSLQSVTLSDHITTTYSYMFGNCISLKCIIIPNGVTTIDSSMATSCNSLLYAVLPNSVTTLGSQVFTSCGLLKTFVFPQNATSAPMMFLYYSNVEKLYIGESVSTISGTFLCYSNALKYVKTLNHISSIDSSAFASNKTAIEYDFTNNTSVPTLSNTSAFSYINPICKIKVPASLETAWKTATNWATYADYIVGVAEPAQPVQIELMSTGLGGGTMDSDSSAVANSIFESGSMCMWGAEGGSATDYTFTTPSNGTTLTCQIVTTDANEGMYTVPDSFQVVVDNNVVLSYPSTVEDITEYMDLSTLPVGTVNLAGNTQVTLRFLEPTGFGDGIVYNLQFEQMPNT